MSVPAKQVLIGFFTYIIISTLNTGQVSADNLINRPPTPDDRKHFSRELNQLSRPLYLVHYLYRECYQVAGEYMFRKINSKTGATYYFAYDADENLLTTDAGVTHSKETIKGGVSAGQLSDCPEINTYERMKGVYLREGKAMGWVFETVKPYCVIPVYIFPQGDKGCQYGYCKFKCPEQVETKLITTDKVFAERIRKDLKPVKRIDKLDPYPKRSCNELD